MQTRTLLRTLLLPALVFSVLAFGACSEEEAQPSQTNEESNTRSDTDLETAATNAVTSSGASATGTVDASNSDNLGENFLDIMETAFTAALNASASSTSAQPLTAPSGHGLYMRDSLSHLLQRTAIAQGTPLYRPLTTYTINNVTVSCTNGGTATVNGTVNVTVTSGSTSASEVIGIDDLTFTFSNCGPNSTQSVWGTIILNADERYTVTQASNGNYTISLTLDDYLDGGLALRDSGTVYRLVFRYAEYGSVTAVITSAGALVSISGSITATATVNGFTCTATVDYSESTGTYTCS